MKKIWKKKISPFGVVRKGGRCIFICAFRHQVKKSFYSISKNEIKDFKKYLKQTLLLKGSTEYAVFVCFDYLFFAYHPLEEDDRLGGIPIPFSFFYGDRDWVYNEKAYEVKNKSRFADIQSHVYIVKDSDHNMQFDNPEQLV